MPLQRKVELIATFRRDHFPLVEIRLKYLESVKHTLGNCFCAKSRECFFRGVKQLKKKAYEILLIFDFPDFLIDFFDFFFFDFFNKVYVIFFSALPLGFFY